MNHIETVRREAERVEQLVRAEPDLSVPVAGCEGWTAHDLVTHLGLVHRWSAAAIATAPDARAPSREEPPGPGAGLLADWFAEGAATLLDAVCRDPDQPCWAFADPRSVAFWRRRQAHETTVHRWDLETALGHPATIEREVALDGIDEVLTVLAPRQVRSDRWRPGTSWVRILVEGRELALGAGAERDPAPVATLRGAPGDLLLVLWGRLDAAEVSVDDDRGGLRDFLRGAPTP